MKSYLTTSTTKAPYRPQAGMGMRQPGRRQNRRLSRRNMVSGHRSGQSDPMGQRRKRYDNRQQKRRRLHRIVGFDKRRRMQGDRFLYRPDRYHPLSPNLLIDSREGARYRGSLPAVSEMSGRLLTRRCRPREKAGDHKTSDRGTCYRPSRPAPARYSAICTAFSAAPFRIWSATHQKVSPLGLAVSIRIRPTYTGIPARREERHGILLPSRVIHDNDAFETPESPAGLFRSDGPLGLHPYALRMGPHDGYADAHGAHGHIRMHYLLGLIDHLHLLLRVSVVCEYIYLRDEIADEWKANLSTRGGRPAAISAYCPSSSAIAPAPAPLAA